MEPRERKRITLFPHAFWQKQTAASSTLTLRSSGGGSIKARQRNLTLLHHVLHRGGRALCLHHGLQRLRAIAPSCRIRHFRISELVCFGSKSISQPIRLRLPRRTSSLWLWRCGLLAPSIFSSRLPEFDRPALRCSGSFQHRNGPELTTVGRRLRSHHLARQTSAGRHATYPRVGTLR